MKKSPLLILSVIFLLALTSCDKVPQAEMDQARAAVESARSTGAEIYAPESFFALQDSLDAAVAMVESQQSNLFKNFDNARTKLASVAGMAATVSQETEITKNALREEIESILNEVTALLEENKQLVTAAPKGKEGAAALEEIKTEIETLGSQVGQATLTFQQGDYYNALEMSKASRERLASINLELKNAISKTGRGRS